jgi:hypothetical protein
MASVHEAGAPPRRSDADVAVTCSPFVAAPRTSGAFWLESSHGGWRNVYVWSPDEGIPHIGCVVYLHGYGENALRNQHVGERYIAEGCHILSCYPPFPPSPSLSQIFLIPSPPHAPISRSKKG